MTDRKPDDLFDALRERLAGYGEEPPAQLWAGIRAQLPPPVAQPMRRRRRRWTPVLLVLLVAVVGAIGWRQWGTTTIAKTALAAARQQRPAVGARSTSSPNDWGTAPAAEAAAGTASRKSTAKSVANSPTTQRATKAELAATSNASKWTSEGVSTATSPAAPGRNGATRIDHTSLPAAASAQATATASSYPAAPTLSEAAAAPASAANADAATVTAPEATAALAARAARAPSQTSRPRNEAGRPAVARAAVGTAVAPDALTSNGLASATRCADGRSKGLTAGATTTGTGGRGRQALPLLAVARGSSAGQSATRRASTAGRATVEAAAASSTKTIAARSRSKQPRPRQTAATLAVVGSDLPPAGRSRQGRTPGEAATAGSGARPTAPGVAADQPTAEAILAGQPVALQVPAMPEPAQPAPIASSPLPLPLPVAARWAVQLVAGPAYTYRALNNGAVTTATSPVPTTRYLNNVPAGSVATFERPALGFGAQASLSRALTRHWTVSAGLGYAEYASRLSLRLVPPAAVLNSPVVFPTSLRQDSAAQSIRRRDTYRFATVPVRLGYAWPLAGRWRVGVLAGADAVVYLGGSSTEGSACACQTQRWGFADSPYRRFSVGASLGADVRYRLSNRWELLAQPTATYLLTSLTTPTSGYAPRNLFGATALLGVSYDLP